MITSNFWTLHLSELGISRKDISCQNDYFDSFHTSIMIAMQFYTNLFAIIDTAITRKVRCLTLEDPELALLTVPSSQTICFRAFARCPFFCWNRGSWTYATRHLGKLNKPWLLWKRVSPMDKVSDIERERRDDAYPHPLFRFRSNQNRLLSYTKNGTERN